MAHAATSLLPLALHDALPISSERAKIALFCNVRPEAVIQALDASSIYAVPLQYHREGLDNEVLRHFGIDAPQPNLARDRKSTRLNSSHVKTSYAVFCLKKKRG